MIDVKIPVTILPRPVTLRRRSYSESDLSRMTQASADQIKIDQIFNKYTQDLQSAVNKDELYIKIKECVIL